MCSKHLSTQLAPLSAIFFCQTLTGVASMAYLNLAMFVYVPLPVSLVAPHLLRAEHCVA